MKKICYQEETECTFELKDSYGNIYTELEEDIIGDKLMINIFAEGVQEHVRIVNYLINKYGTKKVRLSIDDKKSVAEKKVNFVVMLNLHEMSGFQL